MQADDTYQPPANYTGRAPRRAPRRGRYMRLWHRHPDLRAMHELARTFTVEAVRGIAAIAQDGGVDADIRLAAWREILDRAYGKPPLAMYLGPDGQATGAGLQIILNTGFAPRVIDGGGGAGTAPTMEVSDASG